jgi:hypothetical protein
MSKRLLLFLFFPFLLSVICIEKYTSTNSYAFVGYKNNYPVFYELPSRNLLLVSNNLLDTLGNFDSSKKPIYVFEDLIVFEVINQGRRKLVLSKSGKENVISLAGEYFYIAGDNNQIYYTDTKTMSIWRATTTGIVEETNLKGYVSGFENECLYFNREHDPNLISANADLFKYDPEDHEKPQKIVE